MDSIYHIDTDLECRVLHYGNEICVASPGNDVSITLRKGRHKLSFISTEETEDSYTVMFEVPENDIEDCIEVRLMPIKRHRLDEEERKRRTAFEAEQRRIQEEKRKLEEAQKKEKEREERRREEEEQQRREQEETERRRLAIEAERQRKEEEKRQLWRSREERYLRFLSVSDEYNGYVIPSLPIIAPQTIYLRFSRYGDPIEYLGKKPISVSDSSVIFPAIKKKRERVTYKESELIDYFAKTAWASIKEFCMRDSRDRFDYIESILKLAQNDLYQKARREKGESKGLFIGPFLSFEERDSIRKSALEGWIQSKMTKVLATTYDYSPSSLCQSYLDSKMIPDRSILTELSLKYDAGARVNFFLYMARKYSKWKDMLQRMLHPDFWEFDSSGRGFERSVLSIKEESSSNVIECICSTYSVVYIDEACNEIVSVPSDYCAVSVIDKGVMAWFKRTEDASRYIMSCRDYQGSELFNTVVDEELLYGINRQKHEFRCPIGSIFHVLPDGQLCRSRGRVLWVSGALYDKPLYDVSLNIEQTDFVYKKQEESFLIKSLPTTNLVGYKNEKYYLFSYQGVFEIQKPRGWDEALARHVKEEEDWKNRRQTTP